MFFGLFVYLEMVVLNCCKLNCNLREKIMDRSVKEYKLDKFEESSDINYNDEQEREDRINNFEQND